MQNMAQKYMHMIQVSRRECVWGIEHLVLITPSGEENIEKLVNMAKKINLEHRIKPHKDYKSLCEALEDPDTPKHFVFSIPHGTAGDKSVEGLEPYLKKDDVIMDASNEHWKNTERRQKKLIPQGIHYVGMGVSGGYQSARHGPSISPGGDEEGLKKVMPFLRQVAAKDKEGRPCTVPVGPGGSGHYVKMVHNGIEQGLMSILCEAWGIMRNGLGMKYEEIADVFEGWNKGGPLSVNFLDNIGVDINRMKDGDGEYVLADIRDKVVQDVDESEGTGTWTCEELARLHIPGPTIAAAHLFRCGSADAAAREAVKKAFSGSQSPTRMEMGQNQEETLKMLEDATYSCFLMAFCQGLHLIKAASKDFDWNIDFSSILQLWRGGCIIQSDYIVDLLQDVYSQKDVKESNLLCSPGIAKELTRCFPGLKKTIAKSIESDQYVPALSASLEYYKYMSSTDLPTQFMEAELDYFGNHMYDLKSEPLGKPVKGKHHFEWKPAKGINEE